MSRIPGILRVAIALVLFGFSWFAGWAWWASTFVWAPLDVPISLTKGHIRTAPFDINADSTYVIRISVDDHADPAAVDDISLIEAAWSVSNAAGPVAHGATNGNENRSWGESGRLGRTVGYFYISKGRYILDVDFLRGASHLNGDQPRLAIFECGTAYGAVQDRLGNAFVVLLICLVVAGYLGIHVALERHRRKLAALAGVHSLTMPGPQPRVLAMNPGEPLQLAVRMGFLPSPSVLLGVCLIAGGIASFTAVDHWLATRSLHPVDMPVSLAAGHVRTGMFQINWEGYYAFQLHVGRTGDPDCVAYPLPQMRWSLYKDRTLVAVEETASPDHWGAGLKPGAYDVNVEILKDASCLNSAHPRLDIIAVGTEPDESLAAVLSWLFLTITGTGTALLLLAGMRRFRCLSAPVVRPWRQTPKRGLPSFGLVAGIVYALLAIIMMVCTTLVREPSVGLRVRLVRPGVSIVRVAGIQPLLVTARFAGRESRPDLYVDSRLVTWIGFDAVLQQELNRRPPNWPVYFEGDPNLEWGPCGQVIDRIRGLRAEVVILKHRKSTLPHSDGRE